MEKIIYFIQKIFVIISIFFILWVGLSTVEVGSCAIKPNYEYSKYNIYVMLTEKE